VNANIDSTFIPSSIFVMLKMGQDRRLTRPQSMSNHSTSCQLIDEGAFACPGDTHDRNDNIFSPKYTVSETL
jgi:hypothetical protein